MSEQYTFDWRLIVGDPDPGLICAFPADAHTGINTVPEYISNYYWYSFTMPESNKKLIVKRLGTPPLYYRTIGVSPDCELTSSYGIANDEVNVVGLEAGEEVFIFFGEIRLGERPSFDWELSIVDLETGDSCEDPLIAEPGTYHVNGTATWYEYTIPFDGNVNMTSVGLNDRYLNTYVEVYDACGGNLIASNDDPGDYSHMLAELTMENLTAGQTIYIKWGTVGYFQLPLDWTLSVEQPDNHAPVFTDATFEIGPNHTNGHIIARLHAEDEDNDELTYAIVSGNDEGAFALNAESGVLTIADATKIDLVNGGHMLHVTASDYFLSTEATLTIAIITSTEGNEESELTVYPNPASEKIFVQLPADHRVRESYLHDISGNLVKVNDPAAREIALTNIKAGIYLLKVNTDKGLFITRIAVVK